MKPQYEDYQAYVAKIGFTEQERLKLGEVMGQANPLASQASREIAMERAKSQLSFGVMPEGLDEMAAFPGIDPAGFHSEADLMFAQRLRAVKDSASVLPQETRNLMVQTLIGFRMEGSGYDRLYQQMLEKSEELRLTQRAQKNALSQEDFDAFGQDVETLRQDKAFAHMDTLLSNLEYATGLRDQLPGPEKQAELAKFIQLPTHLLEDLHGKSQEITPPNRDMSMVFGNFDNVLRQRYLAHPENWGKGMSVVPNDYRSPQLAQQAIDAYAVGTVKSTLDHLYGKTERNPLAETAKGVNRGNLITVDGETIQEKMRGYYQDHPQLRGQNFDTWYKQNLSTKTAEFVAGGLMAGKRVEAFVPDKTGVLPQAPITIAKAGYEPSSLKPVSMNAWEKFFSKFGFFKQKVAQGEEYDRVMAGRETVQAANQERLETVALAGQRRELEGRLANYETHQMSNPSVRASFFANYEATHGSLVTGASPTDLGVARTAPVSICMCKMMADGYPLEAVLDPNQLQQEKQALGNQYMAMAMQDNVPKLTPREGETPQALEARQQALNKEHATRDGATIGAWIYQGQKKVVEALDARLQGADFANLEQRADFHTLHMGAKMVFDASQEKGSPPHPTISQGYLAAAEADFSRDPAVAQAAMAKSEFQDYQPGTAMSVAQQKACVSYVDGPANSFGMLFNAYHTQDLAKTDGDVKGKVIASASLAVLKEAWVNSAKENPTASPRDLRDCAQDLTAQNAVLMAVAESPALEDGMERTPAFQRDLFSGRMEQQFTGMEQGDMVTAIQGRIEEMATNIHQRNAEIAQHSPMSQPEPTPMAPVQMQQPQMEPPQMEPPQKQLAQPTMAHRAMSAGKR